MKNKFLILLLAMLSSALFSQVSAVSRDSLQSLLQSGKSPKSLINAGVEKDSLYALTYQGGYIFYFFEDNTGLAIAKKNLKYKKYKKDGKVIWGCRGEQVGGTKTEIGTGLANTKIISEAKCSLYDVENEARLKSAADMCLLYRGAGFDDWYLPSKDELHEAYMALAYTSKVNFGKMNYWTSSEKNKDAAWVENLAPGYREFDLSGQSYFHKFYARSVRPIRNFK